jgi:hypothetical protein
MYRTCPAQQQSPVVASGVVAAQQGQQQPNMVGCNVMQPPNYSQAANYGPAHAPSVNPMPYNNYNNSPDETNLDELIQNLQLFCNNNKRAVEYSPQPLSVDSASATANNSDKRFKSMLNLGSSSAPVSVQPDIDMMMTDPTSSVRVPDTNRAKSMEFLLDEDNKSTVQVRIFLKAIT